MTEKCIQQERDYTDGWYARADGVPLDPNKSGWWQEGWTDKDRRMRFASVCRHLDSIDEAEVEQ